MDKVSIIVPVYNGQRFLDRCVNSLLAQSYENLEILLLDDGSKDDSLALCRRREEKDPRIKVYTHENHGVSFTRNRGLELFTGDWVTFVDCDDTVEKDYVKVLLKGAAEHGVFVSQCRRMDVINGREQSFRQHPSKLLTCEEALLIMGDYFSPGICCKLYHRSLVNENGPLRFDEDIRIGEDHLFWCRAVMKAQKVYAAEEYLYRYIENTAGAMKRLSFESSYTDFIARERSLPLFDQHPFLKSVHVSDWVRVAEETLFLYQKGDDKEKKKRLLGCIGKHRKTLLQCEFMSLQEKIKVLLINFPLFRKLWNARQTKKATRH